MTRRSQASPCYTENLTDSTSLLPGHCACKEKAKRQSTGTSENKACSRKALHLPQQGGHNFPSTAMHRATHPVQRCQPSTPSPVLPPREHICRTCKRDSPSYTVFVINRDIVIQEQSHSIHVPCSCGPVQGSPVCLEGKEGWCMQSAWLATSLPEGQNLLCHPWSQNFSHCAGFSLYIALWLFALLSGRQVLVTFYSETAVLAYNDSTGMRNIADYGMDRLKQQGWVQSRISRNLLVNKGRPPPGTELVPQPWCTEIAKWKPFIAAVYIWHTGSKRNHKLSPSLSAYNFPVWPGWQCCGFQCVVKLLRCHRPYLALGSVFWSFDQLSS